MCCRCVLRGSKMRGSRTRNPGAVMLAAAVSTSAVLAPHPSEYAKVPERVNENCVSLDSGNTVDLLPKPWVSCVSVSCDSRKMLALGK